MLNQIVLFIPGLIIGHSAYEKLGVEDYAKENGVELHIHHRPKLLTISQRAKVLYEAIKLYHNDKKIHLLAHSAGGIDAIELVANYPDIRQNILSVTVWGSPMKGTPLADLYIHERSVGNTLFKLAKRLHEDGPQAWKVIEEMTTPYMTDYIARTPMVEGIPYYSMVVKSKRYKLDLSSFGDWDYLAKLGYESDSTVPVESQAYGQVIAEFDGSHKSSTLPIRYWFSFSNWEKEFGFYFEHIRGLKKAQLN